jgi:ribosome-associated protein
VTSGAPRSSDDDEIWSHVSRCAEAALDTKGSDLVILDLRGITSLADYFVIVSGRSDTQVRAIAEAVEERGRTAGKRPISVEGSRNGQWVLIDYGDIVVHVFYGPVREHYDLERLWNRAQRRPLPEQAAPSR